MHKVVVSKPTKLLLFYTVPCYGTVHTQVALHNSDLKMTFITPVEQK